MLYPRWATRIRRELPKLSLLLIAGCLLLCPTAGSIAADSPDAPTRAARSVHLWYPAPQAVAFYNEVTVERSTPGSYFMVCGFNHGYFGIQEKGRGEKVALFSIWDPTKGDEAKSV